MNKCFQLRRVKLLSFHKKLSEIKRKFIYFDKKTFSFKTQFSTKIPRNMKYFHIFYKKEFLLKYEIVQYSLLKGEISFKRTYFLKIEEIL